MSDMVGAARAVKLVNVADLSPVDEPFVELPTIAGMPVEWMRHSGLPRSAVERAVKRPRLSRYRAAWQAVSDARRADAVISHLPRMSAAVADIARVRRVRAPHLAFSFNFTDLPGAAGRARFRASLGGVEQFCTYTAFEAGLYADAFALPRERFRPVTWTQGLPAVGPVDEALVPASPFVVAIGGEGRDFAMLTAAARALPEVPFVVIARPTPALADPPANMTVRFNLPFATCWGVAARAVGLLVPLRGPETCCGHITLVSGRMLGLPIVTTASRGTDEYTRGFAGTTLVPAGDADAWVQAIRGIVVDPAAARAAAAPDAAAAPGLYDRAHWSTYVADFVERHRG